MLVICSLLANAQAGKDMCLPYQQTLIGYGFAKVDSGYPICKDHCLQTDTDQLSYCSRSHTH